MENGVPLPETMSSTPIRQARGTPRVSVLMPCYNGELFLEDAIRSILQQTFEDFELIVVDDGSKDKSPDILKRLALEDHRLKIVTKENGGIVSALNAGLAVCRGEYIARMDADDVSFENRLAFQVRYLDDNQDCVLVGGYALDECEPSAKTVRTTGGRHNRTNLRSFPPKVATAVHPLVMIRKSALTLLKGYRSGFPYAEDYDMFIRIGAIGDIENPPVDLLYYRRHKGAVSVNNVEVQERAAAMAEYDAMAREKIDLPPQWLFEPYVRMRIWRRYLSVDETVASLMIGEMLGYLFSVTPRAFFSYRYFCLRTRICFIFLRFIRSRSRVYFKRIRFW